MVPAAIWVLRGLLLNLNSCSVAPGASCCLQEGRKLITEQRSQFSSLGEGFFMFFSADRELYSAPLRADAGTLALILQGTKHLKFQK